jgi:hypothetical protein
VKTPTRSPRGWTGGTGSTPEWKIISGWATPPARTLPSQHFAVNAAWLRTHAIACDLIAWLRLLGCDPALARAEPATLQYTVFHTPATLTRGGRRRRLNFPPHWPWTDHIQTIFGRLFALPAPT